MEGPPPGVTTSVSLASEQQLLEEGLEDPVLERHRAEARITAQASALRAIAQEYTAAVVSFSEIRDALSKLESVSDTLFSVAKRLSPFRGDAEFLKIHDGLVEQVALIDATVARGKASVSAAAAATAALHEKLN
jgi:hypothetical protein